MTTKGGRSGWTPLAAILEYHNTNDLTRLLGDDERGTHLVRTLGGWQTVSVITEAGIQA